MSIWQSVSSKSVVEQLAVSTVLAVVLGWVLGAGGSYHIHSFDQAFFRYEHDRTPVNEAALRLEEQKLQHLRNMHFLKAIPLVFFLTNCIYSALMRRARLAALGLLATCATFLAYVGIPSFPIDRRCCSVWINGIGMNESAIQLFALCASLGALALLAFALIWHHLRTKQMVGSAGLLL